METLAKTFNEQLLFPPFWGGAIINVSIDSPPQKGGRRNLSEKVSVRVSIEP